MRLAVRLCSLRKNLKIIEADGAAWKALAHFHYRCSHPGAISRVFAIVGKTQESPVGVIVYAMPTLNCRMRNVVTDNRYCGPNRSAGARLLNRELRRISRVVIHPAWRGIGLGCWLVSQTLHRAGTNYVEALAAMGRVHPLFEKAGMARYDLAGCHEAEPVARLFEEYGLDPSRCGSHDLVNTVNQLPTHHQKRLVSTLTRYTSRYGRIGRKIQGDLTQMILYVLSHLTLRPVYYFWNVGAVRETPSQTRNKP
jgi:hypothetical protein